jgi:hypothetical protein
VKDNIHSVRTLVEYLIGHPEGVGQRVEQDHAFGEVEDSLPWMLDQMKQSGRRWVVILEVSGDSKKYVQALVTSSGSIWVECVSNAYLDVDQYLDDAQCELLPSLGWEWPGPPSFPNWHFHDELLDTGTAIAGLMCRTLGRVFEVKDVECVHVIVLPLMENLERIEQL